MLNPNLIWAQRDDYVWITVDVSDAENIQFDLTTDSLAFTCNAAGKEYGFKLELFKPVIIEDSKYLKHRLVDICLRKSESEDWPRLTSDNKKYAWIKVDWSKWQDSDTEEEPAPFDMSNMGGFGDFGMPNNAFSDFAGGDSDDEDEIADDVEDSEAKSVSSDAKLIEELNQAS